MKKKIIAALLAAALIVTAASCGNGEKKQDQTGSSAANDQETKVTAESYTPADDIAKAVLAEVPISEAKSKDSDKLSNYFTDLDPDSIADFAFYVCPNGGAYPDELGIFRFDSDENAKNAVTTVMDHLIDQKTKFEDYPIAKDEMYKFDDAVVAQEGPWVYYILTSNNTRAEEIVKGYIG